MRERRSILGTILLSILCVHGLTASALVLQGCPVLAPPRFLPVGYLTH